MKSILAKYYNFIIKFLIIKAFLSFNVLNAQSGEKFEPPDGRVIHGLGQYVPVDYDSAENWQMVTDYQNAIVHVPVIYSIYAAIDSALDALDPLDYVDVTTNHGYPYALLIGLFLTEETRTNIPVQKYLNGNLDAQIIKLANRIKEVEHTTPVFLRPGFEFGHNNQGTHTDNGLDPNDFISVWQYIYDIFDQQNVSNVAWVWNTVNPDDFSYMNWYPGDNYVDWWGINYFSVNQMNNSSGFLSDAATQGKPVMICESAPTIPESDGGTTNSANWVDWFIPYFDLIKNTTHMKAFVYISDPWTRGSFSDWPDTEIDSDPTGTIANNYQAELDNTLYLHMDEYQKSPGIIDSPLPITLSQFSVSILSDSTIVKWRTESEINNQGFNLYRAESSHDLSFQDLEFMQINVDLIPGAGNSSTGQSYSYIDTRVIDDRYYWYQLEDVAFDGKRTRHPPLKVYRPAAYQQGNKDINLLAGFRLDQNFPNPFNEETIIRYHLMREMSLLFNIYSSTGELLLHKKIFDKPQGVYQINWQGIDTQGNPLPSGVYFYQIKSEFFAKTRRMVLVR